MHQTCIQVTEQNFLAEPTVTSYVANCHSLGSETSQSYVG